MSVAVNDLKKCAKCGTVVEVIAPGKADEECENSPTLVANTVDASQEKHVPVVEDSPDGMVVRVGSVPHPMLEAHYIQMIEVIDGKMLYRRNLTPGEEPVAVFPVKYHSGMVVREYCNLHGLWQK